MLNLYHEQVLLCMYQWQQNQLVRAFPVLAKMSRLERYNGMQKVKWIRMQSTNTFWLHIICCCEWVGLSLFLPTFLWG
jgi:hypothetical protein